MVHIYNGILAIKKNDFSTFAATWTALEEIMLSKISQAEKNNYHITYVWNIRNSMEDIRRRKGKMNEKKSERETNHESLFTLGSKQRAAGGEGVGGWGHVM